MDALLLKAAAKGREVQERREAERRKALMVLMLRHLLDHGYLEAADRLSKDANVSMSKYDAADNISLLRILQDFEEEQEQRYGKRPKLVKQLLGSSMEVPAAGGVLSRQVSRQPSQHQHAQGVLTPPLCPAAPMSGQLAAHLRRDKAAAAAAQAGPASPSSSAAGAAGKLPTLSRPVSQGSSNSSSKGSQHSGSAKQDQQVAAGSAGGSTAGSSSVSSNSSRTQSADGSSRPSLEVCGQGCEVGTAAGAGPKQRSSQGNSSCDAYGSDEEADAWAARLLKPLPTTLLGELRQLGAAISQEIYLESPNVKWGDIAGLADTKRLLQEAVGLPMRYPQLFTGLLAPWRGVLLYGPPGTGKTLLAKAVATSCRTTFFNISASSIVSKWRGDSEKLVRVLFDLARHHAPATIFLDEVDALMGARGAEGEHEASRRMKTELLIQMDGLTRSSSSSSGGSSEPQVFVLAASNLPWHLDPALLRRLQKRILVPLPDAPARRSMLQGLLAGRADGVGLDGLVDATEGYSGSDITLLAKEAAMRPLRRLLAVLEPGVYAGSDEAAAAGPCTAAGEAQRAGAAAAGSPAAEAAQAGVVEAQLGSVTAADLAGALSVTNPAAGGYERQYAEFTSRVGQAG